MQEWEIKKCLIGMGIILAVYVPVVSSGATFLGTFGIVAASVAAVCLMAGWGIYCLHCLCRKIRYGADILAEIVGESRRETTNDTGFKRWKECLHARFSFGAVGDLYSRIWECALISQERTANSHKEQRYLREMMTDISHQIKTPLAALQVFLDIFWQEMCDRDTAEEAERGSLEKMYEQANMQIQRMQWLVMGLLKCTQLESGASVLHKEKRYLGATVAACVETLTTLWKPRQQQIVISGERDASFDYDEEWLSEAIINILKNACEHAPVGGEIQISWQQNSIATRLEISDTGKGIPYEELPKIFNRFYRGQGEYSASGVGIGLALAKDIVERHGGTIVAESQTGEASYTKFVMTFLRG